MDYLGTPKARDMGLLRESRSSSGPVITFLSAHNSPAVVEAAIAQAHISAESGNLERAACEYAGAWRSALRVEADRALIEKVRSGLRDTAMDFGDATFAETMYRDLQHYFSTDFPQAAADALVDAAHILLDIEGATSLSLVAEMRDELLTSCRFTDVAALDMDCGVLLRNAGRFAEALVSFNAALDRWELLGNPLGVAEAQAEIKSIHMHTDEIDLTTHESHEWLMLVNSGKVEAV